MMTINREDVQCQLIYLTRSLLIGRVAYIYVTGFQWIINANIRLYLLRPS